MIRIATPSERKEKPVFVPEPHPEDRRYGGENFDGVPDHILRKRMRRVMRGGAEVSDK